MRVVELSTDVFAAIWANRQNGEESEDDILRRILSKESLTSSEQYLPSKDIGGVHDARNDVHFAEGFGVFRHYKGGQYRAVANNGAWVREDTGQRFSSLSALNQSIVAGNENIWNGNWKYLSGDGKTLSINELRKS